MFSSCGVCPEMPESTHVPLLIEMMRHISPVSSRFRHSSHQDETVTSVCSECHLTVGRAPHRADLKELEQRHVCQPEERRRVVRIAHHIYLHEQNGDAS